MALKKKKKSFLYRIATRGLLWEPNGQEILGYPRTTTPTPKRGLHPKKSLLRIGLDMREIHSKLLPEGQRMDAERYAAHLKRLLEEIERNRPWTEKAKRNIILLHDNARSHIAKSTRGTTDEMRWEVLSHPAYGPDLAASDCHLFLGFKIHLNEKCFKNSEELKNVIDQYFSSLDFF
ncbi:hypothetical protein OESDEN_02692 [Oesophagostomum dentatum]|uniref:Transposase n=1 Tax=Oesophagostomum dentatum TaxID=61180 RepID=A0A0B1TMJ7_OESDE|nr:hypothetical protein OESDEN_02692 [Oesophagostomum dentatum]